MKQLYLLSLLWVSLSFAQTNQGSLKVGDLAPQFTGVDQFDQNINSEEILRSKKLLVIFYRGYWCPHCRKHLSQLQEHLKSLESKQVKVVVVSPEKIEKTKATSEALKAEFSVVHDKDNAIMNAFQVAFEVNEETVPKYYKMLMKKLDEYNVAGNNTLPVPATYLIGQDGKILYAQYNEDYKERSDFKDIFSVLTP